LYELIKKTISSSDTMQEIVAVPNELLANGQQTSKQSEVDISGNQIKIPVTNDTSPELLRMVLELATGFFRGLAVIFLH